MLKKLTLVNFRSHKHTVIDFDEGVNIIVGRGQAGKTNIKRALEWLCTNRPRGDKVHSYWCEKGDITRVEVQTTDGYIIAISKTVGDSVEYSLQYPEGRKAQWSKVNAQVPDKILEALNLCELNIQNQLDQPYLITAGTGEISRAVNQAVDLDQADQWVTDINKRKKNNQLTIATLSGQLESAQLQLKEYEHLPAVQEVIEKATHVRKALDDCKRESFNLSSMITKINQAMHYCEQLKDLSTIENLLGAAITTQATLNKVWDKQVKVEHILNEVEDSQLTLNQLEATKVIDQLFTRIGNLSLKHVDLYKRARHCVAVLNIADEFDDIEEKLEDETKKYTDLLDELGVCPMCFTPVDDETLEYVIEGLRGE